MTVCIAALYENGKGIVLVSDKMLTLHSPMAYEYENEEFEKIRKIVDEPSVYCLSAGTAVFASEIMDTTKSQIGNQKMSSVKDVAEMIRNTYVEYRKSRIVKNELQTRGLDLNSYYSNHKVLLPGIVQAIDNVFRTLNLGVEFIIAGKDSSGCHIYTIAHPGELFCLDSIGYISIGIGAPHVVYHMIEYKYRKSSDKDIVVKLVDDAKIRSQVAPGVGEKSEKILVSEGR